MALAFWLLAPDDARMFLGFASEQSDTIVGTARQLTTD